MIKSLDRVEELTKALTIGDPADPSNFMATVIDAAAFNKIIRVYRNW